ncbi:MAG: hypothetical protein NZ960_07460 [Candidatus Kapabacteria bacterium]|nr:hypothetical protein [Candidatus Kapabacteria bacterium]MDW8012818.1 hypothetical protein [Bacteroidota bacterium]
MAQRTLEEIRDALEAVEILRLLVSRAREELRSVAPYLVAFGAYSSLNLLLMLLGYGGLWAELLLPAFALATSVKFGPFPTVFLWASVAAAALGVLWLFQNPLITWSTLFVGIGGTMGVLYLMEKRRGRLHEGRLVFSPWIGVGWGMLAAGMWLLVLSPTIQKAGTTTPELYGALWGYAIGLGLVVTGLLSPLLLWAGVLGIVGAPLAALYFQSGEALLVIFLVMAVAMIVVGGRSLLGKSA